MSQRKKKIQENEKPKKRVPKSKKEDHRYTIHCRFCDETYVSRKVDNKLIPSLTRQSSTKKDKISENNKEEKIVSKNCRKIKTIEKTPLSSDTPGCSTSPALSDKTSDSDLIVISEADSGLSERVSSSSDHSVCSPGDDYISKLSDGNVLPFSTEKTESIHEIPNSKCNVSISLNDSNLDTIETDKILPYESAFAATLPNLEINYESDFSDLMESVKTQNTVEENLHLCSDSNILNQNNLIDQSQQIMSEHYNSLQDLTIPNYLSPKENFLSLINNINSVCDSKEDFICNQLRIEPLIKPPDFNYEENSFVDFAVDISMLRAANNYIKERSKSQIVSTSVPDISGSAWHNSIVKLSDPFLNLSGNCSNQFSSEDNESEISISSCKTSDIQPEFFDMTFSENPENISEENLSDFVSLSPCLNINTNDLCSVSEDKQMVNNTRSLDNNNNAENLHETKPKAKRKRKRCIWDTKKRRCNKKVKKKCMDLNFNSELNAGIFCDTCDESEAEIESDIKEKESSSEIGVNHNKNQSIKHSVENEAFSNQFLKLNDAEQCQNILKEKGNSCIMKKSNLKKNVKTRTQNLEVENPLTVINTKLCHDSCEVNQFDSFSKPSDNCLISSTIGNFDECTQNLNVLTKPNKRKREKESSFGNHEKNSIIPSKASNESPTKTHSPEQKKEKLQKHDFQNRKTLKCSVELSMISQSRKMFSKSNVTPQKSVTTEQSINIVTDKEFINDMINNCSVNVTLQELDASMLNKYCKKTNIQEVKINESKNKKNLKNKLQEGSDITSNVCDEFVQEQNSDLLSDNSLCLKSATSHSIIDHSKKNAFNLVDVQENNVMLSEYNALTITANDVTHEDSENTKKSFHAESDSLKISEIEYPSPKNCTNSSSKHLLNKNISEIASEIINYKSSGNNPLLDSEIQRNECILMTDNSNKTMSEIKVVLKNIPASKFQENQNSHISYNVDNSTEKMSGILDAENVIASNLQENGQILIADNSNKAESDIQVEHISKDEPYCDNTVNSIPIEKDVDSVPSTISNFHNEHPQSETVSFRKDISSDLCKVRNDYNIDSLTVETCTNSQKCYSTLNRSKTNNEQFEIKSPTNTETITLGLTDDDLDYELDPQDLKNENFSDSDESVFKSSNDHQNPFKTVSDSVVQDHLSRIDTCTNIIDSDMNNQEDPFSSANNLQQGFSNFEVEESYSSADDDDDSDSDKDYSFKRSHERRTYLPHKTLEDANALEKCLTDFPEQIHKHYEPLTKVLDENNFSFAIDKKDNKLGGDKSNCGSDNDKTQKSISSRKVALDTSLRLKDVVAQIKEYCSKEMGIEAVQVADTFISISSTSDVNKSLFKNLLLGLFSFIVNSSNCEISLSNIFDDVLQLMHKFEIYDKKLLSYFIIKCYEHSELNSYTKKVFDCCLEKKVPLSNKAINAFNSLLKSEELDLIILLDYIEYIKSVCKKKVPKNLIHSALEKSKTCKYKEMHHLCKIMCNVTSKEVNELDLKEFVQTIFEKKLWGDIAELFILWNTKNDLSTCIYLALVSRESEFMAEYYGKFADAIHNEVETLNPQQKLMFGRIGTALMLQAFTRKNLDCALKILYILHSYNVNYYELELAFCKFYQSQSYPDAETFEVKVLPFFIVFVAVDIFLHFERPKDAFTIFQEFSWVTPNENLDQEVRMYVLTERYHRLIKLVPLLNDKDSLHQGWEALKILLTAVEQGLVQETLEDKNQDSVEENSEQTPGNTKENAAEIPDTNKTKEKTPIQCMRSIYNDYLISLINFDELSSAYDLYEHSFGPKRDIFSLNPDVLRGLVVAFSNSGEYETAKSIFMHGLFIDVYPIKKPELSSAPWDIVIRSEWTVPEIKFVIDWFISMLSPLLSAKPKETNFEKWFSLKIVFKIKYTLGSRINCLVETNSEAKYYINKTKNALQSMNPSLQYTEDKTEEALSVTSDSLYNYWKSKWCNDSTNLSRLKQSPVLRQRQKRFSFGEFNAPSEKEISTLIGEKTLQSPKIFQTHLAEYLVSDYIDEIRSSTSCGILPSASPKISPNKIHQNVPNISTGTSSTSDKETSFACKNVQSSSQRLSDSITQISNPIRLRDTLDKKYQEKKNPIRLRDNLDKKYQEKKDPVFVHNSPSMLSNSNNSKIVSESNSPSIKNKIAINTFKQKYIKKLNSNSKKNNKVSLDSEKLTNMNKNLKNFTVSFAANSSTRIVSNSSKTFEKISHNNLQDSQLSFKRTSQDSPALKTVKTSAIKNKSILNKSNVIFHKAAIKNSPNQQAANAGSNLVVKVNQTEQVQREAVIVSISKPTESISNEKISSTVRMQNRDSDTTVSNNISVHNKVPKCLIKRTVTSTNQNSVSNVKASTTIISQNKNCDAVVSSNNSTKCKVSKPVIKRDIHFNLEDSSKTKFKAISTSTPCSHLNNSSILHQHKEQGNIEKTKLVRQKMINNEKTSKPVLGNSCNPEEFSKILQFLKIKIRLKHKHLSPDQEHKKALTLAETFIQTNDSITKLDKRTMKMLLEFERANV